MSTHRYRVMTHFAPIEKDPDTHGFHAFTLHDKSRSGLWYDIHVWCLDQFGPEDPKATWKIDEPYGYFVFYDETMAAAFKLRWCV